MKYEPKRKKRRIMRALKLEEISSVDAPAQQGALATILKRHDNDRTHSEGVQLMSKPNNFEEGVVSIQKRDPSLSPTAAWSRAARLWPDLVEKFETDGIAVQTMHEQIAKTDLEVRNAPEVREFEALCDDIQARDRCSRLDAMRKAARSMDGESFEKFRAALD